MEFILYTGLDLRVLTVMQQPMTNDVWAVYSVYLLWHRKCSDISMLSSFTVPVLYDQQQKINVFDFAWPLAFVS